MSTDAYPGWNAQETAVGLRLEREGVVLWRGDCLEVLPLLEAGSVRSVITSPPYANQRKAQYGGIEPSRYPVWTANWFMAAEKSLAPDSSLLVNIREHIADGQISDYVHRTRMLLREIGFVECEEIIWCKPDSPPVGSTDRPRRAWERVLWFGNSNHAYCDPKANGQHSERLGLRKEDAGAASLEWMHGHSGGFSEGRSRHRDYIECGTGKNDAGVEHPARYPTEFAQWMVNGWSPEGACVLDPFMGSGTTGIACVDLSRRFVGIERNAQYFNLSVQRITSALQAEKSSLFPAKTLATQPELF